MRSLVKVLLLLAVLLAAGCGGSESKPFIKSWSAPFASLTSGTTAPLSVELNQAVLDKTYIDITTEAGDEAYVKVLWNGVESKYLIIAAGEKSGSVEIQAQTVSQIVTVTLTFKIRDSTEQRPFTFSINP
jgi:hypothetical protein